MRRLFLALCIIALCSTLSSGGVTQDKLKVIARQTVAGGGGDNCSGGEKMGYDSIGVEESTAADASARVMGVFTAPCTGTLDTAYIYHRTTDTHNAKIAVYIDSGDGIPDDVGDTLVEKSPTINTTDIEWASAAFAVGQTITKNSTYWIVIYGGDGNNFAYNYDADASLFSDYDSSCDGFDDAINEITYGGGCSYPEDDNRKYSIYVTLAAP